MPVYIAELAPVPADDSAIAAASARAKELGELLCFRVLHASAHKTAGFLVQISDYGRGKLEVNYLKSAVV